MATPKKKVSRSRKNMRRFSYKYKLEAVSVVTCASCSDQVRPHRVCKCGAYNGKQVLPAPPQPTLST